MYLLYSTEKARWLGARYGDYLMEPAGDACYVTERFRAQRFRPAEAEMICAHLNRSWPPKSDNLPFVVMVPE